MTWRRGDEIGLDFPVAAVAAAAAAKPRAAVLVKRVAELEGKITSLRKVLKRMKRDQERQDDEAVA